jgi:hypothetical protein
LFQNQVMDEVQALADRLRTAERGNFVDLYFENEGEPHFVFRFLRDPAKTLARYTKNPRFRSAPARYSDEQLRAAMDFMMETFREERVIQAAGLGNKANRAEVEIAVTEPEFRALVAKKGVRIPEAVDLRFRAQAPANSLNRPLPPAIARLVRIFPRGDRPFGALHAINSYARWCWTTAAVRVSGGTHDKALILFPLGAQLFVDRDNRLAYGAEEAPGYARVGEELVSPAPSARSPRPIWCGRSTPPAGRQGGGDHRMRSAAAEHAQNAVSQNAQALRQFRENYGLSEPWRAAWWSAAGNGWAPGLA